MSCCPTVPVCSRYSRVRVVPRANTGRSVSACDILLLTSVTADRGASPVLVCSGIRADRSKRWQRRLACIG